MNLLQGRTGQQFKNSAEEKTYAALNSHLPHQHPCPKNIHINKEFYNETVESFNWFSASDQLAEAWIAIHICPVHYDLSLIILFTYEWLQKSIVTHNSTTRPNSSHHFTLFFEFLETKVFISISIIIIDNIKVLTMMSILQLIIMLVLIILQLLTS